MSKKGKSSKGIPYFRRFMEGRKNQTPEAAVESYLVDLKELDDKLFSFWEDYWAFLGRQRERRIDDISDALYRSRTEGFSYEKCARIVSAPYSSNPLCTAGSVIQPPGGRFNFGSISSSLTSFHCLYVGNDHDTAYAEKYLIEKGEKVGEGELSPEELRFEDSASHIFCRVDVDLECVLDIRKESSLEKFVEVISEIEPSSELQRRATQLGVGSLTTVKDIQALKRSLFEKNFKQWGVWFDLPSNSQWLGHYVRKAGIQGIVYPSCRTIEGFNIAIYPDTFPDSDSVVKLRDKFEHISEDKMMMNQETYKFFQGNNKSSTVH